MEPSSGLPIWGQLLISFFGFILGGGTIAAVFKYRADRQKNSNDLLLGQLTAGTEEESAEVNRWELLVTGMANRLVDLETRVKTLETEKGLLQTENNLLTRQSNLKDIYIDRLIAVITPPVPDRPAGML